MENIEGAPSELIDRLLEIASDGEEGTWFNLGFSMVLQVGDDRLKGVVPDTGRDYPPGSVGDIRRRNLDLVSRDAHSGRIRDRMAELVLSGVNEGFLVRSLRDHLRRDLETYANVGARDEKRRMLVETIEQSIGHPESVDQFRSLLIERDPSDESLTDEQVLAKTLDIFDSFYANSALVESAVDKWAALTQWDERVSRQLSDEVIEEWVKASLRRMTGL